MERSRGAQAWVDLTELVREHPPTKSEIDQVLLYRRRKAKARFYSDENFPSLAVRILEGMGGQVVTAQEAGLRRHPDENHAAYALRNGYVLVTCDRDYLDEGRFPLIHCPAIVVLDFGAGSAGEIRRALTCVERILSFPQFFDKWVKIDAKRDSWAEYVRHLDGTTDRCRLRVHRGKIQEWVGPLRIAGGKRDGAASRRGRRRPDRRELRAK